MSVATLIVYQHSYSGRIAPAGSRKSSEIKPFYGYWSAVPSKAHCIKDRVLLDPRRGM